MDFYRNGAFRGNRSVRKTGAVILVACLAVAVAMAMSIHSAQARDDDLSAALSDIDRLAAEVSDDGHTKQWIEEIRTKNGRDFTAEEAIALKECLEAQVLYQSICEEVKATGRDYTEEELRVFQEASDAVFGKPAALPLSQ
jgi:hypothetical protein